MRYNRTRHSLLKHFAKRYFENNPNNKSDFINSIKGYEVGICISKIDDILNVSASKRDLILSELINSKEIIYYNLENNKGFFIENTVGLSALAEKKYLKRNNEIVLNWLKHFVQIFIPIASLIIGILALSLRFNNINNKYKEEIKEINLKILKIDKKIEDSIKKQSRSNISKE